VSQWEALDKRNPQRKFVIAGDHELEIQAIFCMYEQARQIPGADWILDVPPLWRTVRVVQVANVSVSQSYSLQAPASVSQRDPAKQSSRWRRGV